MTSGGSETLHVPAMAQMVFAAIGLLPRCAAQACATSIASITGQRCCRKKNKSAVFNMSKTVFIMMCVPGAAGVPHHLLRPRQL